MHSIPITLPSLSPKTFTGNVKKLADIKSSRAEDKVREKLKSLKNTANSETNLMPLIIDCVKSYATLGEICDQLRDVFGEYKDSVKI